MINNRMLAVAAVLVMAVPALGAATPIVVPPVPEQLVEGHTVFTVIEIVAVTQTNETRFAAAVAVLVREYQAEERAQRFPGVLWFNDQYLVNPYQDANEDQSFRYPCGGAVIAVNRGDPDPRMAIARVNTGNPAVIAGGTAVVPAGFVDSEVTDATVVYGDDSYTYDETWTKPYPGTYYYGQDGNAANDPDAPSDYAWIGANPDQGTVNADDQTVSGNIVYSDTVLGATAGGIDGALFNLTPPWDYRESYLITDPNDHSWVIDKYEFYTRDTNAHSQNEYNLGVKGEDVPMNGDFQPSEHSPIASGGLLETQYAYPVWVVNMLGSPVFVPDNGIGGVENCAPFKDLLEDVTAPLQDATCGYAGAGAIPPWTDDPCMGYQEPSRNGYCYGGQSAADGCFQGPTGNCDDNRHMEGAGPGAAGCGYAGSPPYVNTPLRQYNALLYFKLDDLRVFGGVRDHSDPTGGTDTNGCSEEQYPWGPNPPQAAYDWQCPGGDDDAEGNSHPFHPSTPAHALAEECAPQFAGPNPANHGGSSYITPDMRANDDGWYEFAAPCDYLHATRNIDIYFNGGGRPFPPPLRNFVVTDVEGSSAPYQDYHLSYEGAAPNSHAAAP